MSEKMHRALSFTGVMKGPEELLRLKEEVAEKTPGQIKTCFDEALESKRYPYSRAQRSLIALSMPRLISHITALGKARRMNQSEPKKLRKTIAKRLNVSFPTLRCDPTDIDTVDFSNLSATATVHPYIYEQIDEEDLRSSGIDPRNVDESIGLSSDKFSIQIGKNRMMLSLRKNGSGNFVLEHEGEHDQYTFIHPYFLGKNQDVTSTGTREEEEKVDTGIPTPTYENIDSLKKTLNEIAYAYLYLFLNELSSKTKAEGSTYDRFFGDDKSRYNARFSKEIRDIIASLPEPELRFTAIEVICNEIAKLQHQMKYLEGTYQLLTNQNIPKKQITAIIQFLTPERGYIIKAFLNPKRGYVNNAFLNQEPKTMKDFKRWKHEYDEGWKTNRSQQTDYWINFGENLLNVDPDRHKPFTDIFVEKVKKHRKRLFDYLKDPSTEKPVVDDLEIESIISNWEMLTLERVQGLQDFFNSSFFKDKKIPDSVKEVVITRSISRAIDFHDAFFDLVQFYRVETNLIPEEVARIFVKNPDKFEEYDMLANETLIKLLQRSLELDDTAEEFARMLMIGQKPDFDKLFKPGFKKSDSERQQAFYRFTRKDDVYNAHLEFPKEKTPLENAVITLFKILLAGDTQISVAGKTYTPQEARRKISSSLLRLLIWAKEKKLPKKEIALVEGPLQALLIDQLGYEKCLPTE